MISLSATLLAAQKAKRRLNPIVKIVLTRSGQATQTYLKDRILAYTSTRSQWSHVVEITLHNKDGAISSLDFKGYKGIMSRGLTGGAGDEFAALDPVWCFPQRYDSGQTEFAGLRPSTLRLIGTFDRMEKDHASEEFRPDNDNATTIKGHLQALAGATMQGFTHTQSFTITFDAPEETILDSITPGDSFRVSFRETRLSVFKKLMAYVKSVALVKADEQIHILNPTVSGSSFAYEYFLDVEDEHTYFSEGFRRRLVEPNILSIASHPDSGTAVAGSADFSGLATASDNSLLDIRDFDRVRIASDQEGQDIADARIQKLEQAADKGYLVTTINVGQEMFDYIQITDRRLGLNRIGNVGQIVERYKPGARNPWEMSVNLGTTPTSIIPFSPGSDASAVVTVEDFNVHLDDAQEFADLVLGILEDHEARITALEDGIEAGTIAFDGAVDPTPSTASWVSEVGLPFDLASVGSLYFSPIIDEVPNVKVVYVLDRGTNFWKYNFAARQWYPLTGTTFSGANCYRTLAINPLGTKLACVSDGGATEPVGRRIEVYDIGDDSWTASSQTPTIVTQNGGLKSIVWEDNDTIWAWARDGTNFRGKCIKWVPSTNTFTVFSSDTGTQTFWQGRNAAIRGTAIVYGGMIGDAKGWFTYTPIGDNYIKKAALSGKAFAWVYDKDKLWYIADNTARQGYIDTADDSENDNQFVENPDRTGQGASSIFGVGDDLADIIVFAKGVPDALMSIRGGGQYLVQTIVSNGFQEVLVEKPADSFTVTFILRNSNTSIAIIDTQTFRLTEGTWDVYYPLNGDITSVVIRLL